MGTITEAINRAVSIKGPEILDDKDWLCDVLEDLVPASKSDVDFVRKSYDDEFAKRMRTFQSAEMAYKADYYKDIVAYLREERGFNDSFINRLLNCFGIKDPTPKPVPKPTPKPVPAKAPVKAPAQPQSGPIVQSQKVASTPPVQPVIVTPPTSGSTTGASISTSNIPNIPSNKTQFVADYNDSKASNKTKKSSAPASGLRSFGAVCGVIVSLIINWMVIAGVSNETSSWRLNLWEAPSGSNWARRFLSGLFSLGRGGWSIWIIGLLALIIAEYLLYEFFKSDATFGSALLSIAGAAAAIAVVLFLWTLIVWLLLKIAIVVVIGLIILIIMAYNSNN